MPRSVVVPRRDEPVIRPMRADEGDTVAALTLDAYDAHGGLTGPYRAHLADPGTRRHGASAVLVAEIDGQVAGTVTFVLPHDPEWEQRRQPAGDAGFRTLAVAPWAEGRGIGRALVEECLRRARDAGARRMVITSMAWMRRAHRLYEALGFVHRPDLDVRFPSGLGHTYVRDLAPDAPQHFPPPGEVPAVAPWFEDVWVIGQAASSAPDPDDP
jgi:GNAT superfamily N-acetyltransferase